jgi:hypothetical protein
VRARQRRMVHAPKSNGRRHRQRPPIEPAAGLVAGFGYFAILLFFRMAAFLPCFLYFLTAFLQRL